MSNEHAVDYEAKKQMATSILEEMLSSTTLVLKHHNDATPAAVYLNFLDPANNLVTYSSSLVEYVVQVAQGNEDKPQPDADIDNSANYGVFTQPYSFDEAARLPPAALDVAMFRQLVADASERM